MAGRSTTDNCATALHSAPKPIKKDGDLLYEVEAVVGVRMGLDGVEYHVKWNGYPSSDNTWIDELPPFFHKGSGVYKKEPVVPTDKGYHPGESDSDSDDEAEKALADAKQAYEAEKASADAKQAYDAEKALADAADAKKAYDAQLSATKKALADAKKAYDAQLDATETALTDAKQAYDAQLDGAEKVLADAKQAYDAQELLRSDELLFLADTKQAYDAQELLRSDELRFLADAKQAYDAQPDVPKRLSHGPCPGCTPGIPPKKRSTIDSDALWCSEEMPPRKKHRTIESDTESD
jgi:hypothetical protein